MYVVVDPQTRISLDDPNSGLSEWKSRAAAEKAAERIHKMCEEGEHPDLLPLPKFLVMDVDTYKAQVPVEDVTDPFTGQVVSVPIDTPWHQRPDAWSVWTKEGE